MILSSLFNRRKKGKPKDKVCKDCGCNNSDNGGVDFAYIDCNCWCHSDVKMAYALDGVIRGKLDL